MASRPSSPKRRDTIIIVLIGVAVIAVAVLLTLFLIILPAISPSSSSITFSSVQTIPQADLNSTARSQGDFVAYSNNNTIWVGSGTTQLAVLAGPPGHEDVFVIDNLTNPTIYAPRAAHLTMMMVNADPSIDHDLAIETTGPPYGHSMMSQMMNAPGTMMLSPYGNGTYMMQQMHMTNQAAGQYWYVCRYPGHAQDGMYGKLVVY